ncbi:hypothetical protein FGO68_gene3945 [Halteria grandinella]|uniref:Uncharacterized protein n=1 Tax=Halteria grandinella TaxID=5974 RepID=A0A8J8T459_HALGN|nr:hypothetical protein FGO68_gene3945 [Halteria grandinella]
MFFEAADAFKLGVTSDQLPKPSLENKKTQSSNQLINISISNLDLPKQQTKSVDKVEIDMQLSIIDNLAKPASHNNSMSRGDSPMERLEVAARESRSKFNTDLRVNKKLSLKSVNKAQFENRAIDSESTPQQKPSSNNRKRVVSQTEQISPKSQVENELLIEEDQVTKLKKIRRKVRDRAKVKQVIEKSLSSVKQSCNAYIQKLPSDFSLSTINKPAQTIMNPHYLSVDKFMLEQHLQLKQALKVSSSLTRILQQDTILALPPEHIVPFYHSDRQYSDMKYEVQMQIVREKKDELKDVRVQRLQEGFNGKKVRRKVRESLRNTQSAKKFQVLPLSEW